jgi:hypothetical protein
MSRRRRRRHRRSFRRFVGGVLCAALGLCLIAVKIRDGNRRPPAVRQAADMRVPVHSASLHHAQRPIYAHSVIRGGVYDAAELTQALGRDKVAAAHYKGFRTAAAKLDRMTSRSPVYLSYRVDKKVYWTRKPVPLPEGEPVLTDGEHMARARCGNRIEFQPQEPVGPDVDLDTPEPPAPSDASPDAGTEPDLFDLPQLVHDLFPPYFTLDLPASGSAPAEEELAMMAGYPAGLGGGGGGGGLAPFTHAGNGSAGGLGSPLVPGGVDAGQGPAPFPQFPIFPDSPPGVLSIAGNPAPAQFGVTIPPGYAPGGPLAPGTSGGVTPLAGGSSPGGFSPGVPMTDGITANGGIGQSPGPSTGSQSGSAGAPPRGPGFPGTPGDAGVQSDSGSPLSPRTLRTNDPSVPEPGGLVLVGAGVLVLWMRRAMR